MTVRLHPQPEATAAAICMFPSVDGRRAHVIQTIQVALPIARCELLDGAHDQSREPLQQARSARGADAAVRIPRHRGRRRRAGAHVARDSVRQRRLDFEWATHQEDARALWQERHDAYLACLQLSGAAAAYPQMVVPVSSWRNASLRPNEDIARASMRSRSSATSVWQYHLVILVARPVPRISRCRSLNERVVTRALANGGTSTREHGIGTGKLDFSSEPGDAVEVMRAIKRTLDTLNILTRQNDQV